MRYLPLDIGVDDRVYGGLDLFKNFLSSKFFCLLAVYPPLWSAVGVKPQGTNAGQELWRSAAGEEVFAETVTTA